MEYAIGDISAAHDVLDLVKKIHYQEIDFEEGDITDRILSHNYYILSEIKLSNIEEVWTYIDEEQVAEFRNLDINNTPPIVLGQTWENGTYEILDGGHRIERSIAENKICILAFVPYNL